VGSHTLYAMATDAAENTRRSIDVPIEVADLILPTLSITSPANLSTVTRKSTVSIQTAVTAGTNPISRVDFTVGSSVVCSDTSSPYQCNWPVPAAPNKTYQIQANAYDSSGNVGTSSVTVSSTSR
jgi:Bacterial Ig domain